MLRLDCPFCGLRDHTEFTYLEDAEHTKPDFQDGDADAWFDAVYMRENPRGPHREYWHHGLGCRMVIAVTRDTVSHDILSVDPAHPEMKTMLSSAAPKKARNSGKAKA